MAVVIHETPGLLDFRAINTFGVNSKPNAVNPIGYFGTGLKYAIAVLLREGIKVTLWIGDSPYVFFIEEDQFRDKTFQRIGYRRQRGVTARWFRENLPFTTELGKNWKLWMALRELHSNTLDEGGRSYIAPGFSEEGSGAEITRIVVEGDAYCDEFRNLGNVFLQSAIDPAEPFQWFEGESEHAYYRGLRAHDLRRMSLFTYNINSSMTLTEDRTLQHGFMADYHIRTGIMAARDKSFIKKVLRAPENTYEHDIAWNLAEKSYASPEFLELIALWGQRPALIFIEKKEPVSTTPRVISWRQSLVAALDNAARDDIVRISLENANALKTLLKQADKPVEQSDKIAF